MRKWCQILPYFVVVWAAKRWGERFYFKERSGEYVAPYPGHLISTKDRP